MHGTVWFSAIFRQMKYELLYEAPLEIIHFPSFSSLYLLFSVGPSLR